jgi:hypothetical protein
LALPDGGRTGVMTSPTFRPLKSHRFAAVDDGARVAEPRAFHDAHA